MFQTVGLSRPYCTQGIITMRKYSIIIAHSVTGETVRLECVKHTFAEAAQEAYMLRSKKGFSWRIISVGQDETNQL